MHAAFASWPASRLRRRAIRCVGEDAARVAATAPPGSAFVVVDPFAGSCNGLFSILQQLPGAEGLGFEFERAIFDMITRNIALLGARIRLVHGHRSI